MNPNNSLRNIKNQVSRPSGESELDESRVLEKRLKKLLTNVGEQEQPRTVFNGIQEVPKLRPSIVTRAVQSVICSTPMVTEKRRDFFCTDNSLNISPIDSISEELEVNEYKTGQDKERSKKLQNEIPQGNFEAKIILTRATLPIVISDSEEEVQSILEEGRSKKSKKNIQVENRYNTRSISRKISESQKTENNVDTEYLKDISNNNRHNLRDTLSVKKNKAIQQNKQNKTNSAQVKVDSLLKNDSTKQNTTNVHTSVKSIQYKSPKNNSSSRNKKNAGEDQIPTTPHQKESVSSSPLNNIHSKSNQNESNKNLNSLDCIDNTKKNYEQADLVSPRLGRSRKFSSKLENEITDQSKRHAIKTRSQDVSAVNDYEQDEPAETVGSWLKVVENANEFKKSVTYNGQNSEKNIKKSGSKSAGKMVSSKKIVKNRDVGKDQRRIPPRKLSFTSKDGDKNSESDVATEEGDENIFEAIEEPVKTSKIPSLRSRTKSRENNLEANINSVKKNVDIKVSVNNEANPSETEKSIPKRPPRKKMLKKKSPIDISEVCENILPNAGEELNGFLKNSVRIEGKTTTTTELQNDTKLQQNNRTNGTEVSENKRNPEKTLVEVGLSPIRFTPEGNGNITKYPKKAAEASLLNGNTNGEREILTIADNEKAKKLNQLIFKLSQYANSLVVDDKSFSDGQLQNENANTNKKNKDLPVPLSNQIEMSNKEVQTSLKRPYLRSRRKASRLTPDLCKKAINFERSNSSKSTLTDSSEIIKDVEKKYLLFESVGDNVTLNFSSSDDEVFGSSSLQNGPWRLDENSKIFPRRSSCKLNFLRSAQEIEMDKELQGHNRCYESDSELDSETNDLENMSKKLSVLPISVGLPKKSKVQMYSKPTLHTNERISKNIAIKSPDVDKRPLTSRTSDFVTSESEPDHAPDEHNKERSSNISKFMEGMKDKSYTTLNKDTTLKVPVQSNKEVIVNENNNFEDIDLVPCLRISSSNTEEAVHKPSPSNEGNENSRCSNKKEKASVSVTKRTSKSNRTNSFDHQMENIVRDDDGEILAVPLECSVPPVLERALETDENIGDRAEHQRSLVIALDNVIKSPIGTLHSENRNANKSQSKRSFIKPVKARAPKSRKKKINPENDDGVSSTTENSEITGIRRSGRERRVPVRRCYGAIATYSERMVEYYNGSSTTCNSTGSKSTKARTKKKEVTKKDANGDTIGKSVEKKGKKERPPKKKSNIQPQELNIDATNSGRADTNVTVIDKFNVGMESSSTKTMNSSTRKHRSETDCDSSTHCTSQDTPNKRSRTMDGNENYQKSSDSTPNNPGNVNTYSHDRSHVAEMDDNGTSDNVQDNSNHFRPPNNPRNVNTYSGDVCHLGEMDNNGMSDNAQDNSNHFCPPSHTISQEDFAFQSSLPQDNLNNSSGKFGSVNNKVAEKDSGRSTMLKSCTFEESNVRIGKSQRGRISKNYKKKNNMCSKISKVLSRSINISREQEIFNEKEVDTIDSLAVNNTEDARSRRTSIMRASLTDDEYINLWSNENLVSLRYVDKTPNFKLVKDNLMVTDGLKNVKDGGTMGYLKIPPAGQKALHIARKFALFYFVIEGEGFVQVHNKTSRVGKLSTFIIPLGIEYSILNISKRDPLNLGFVKMPAGHGSQDGS